MSNSSDNPQKIVKPMSKCCKIQSIILKAARDELNLMLSEVCQLKEEVDFTDQIGLTKTVLKKITTKEIHSVHFTPEEAKHYLDLFEECESTKKITTSSFKETSPAPKSTFHDSPF